LKNLSNSPHRQEVMLVKRGKKCYRYWVISSQVNAWPWGWATGIDTTLNVISFYTYQRIFNTSFVVHLTVSISRLSKHWIINEQWIATC
jgi:hypothetical protein